VLRFDTSWSDRVLGHAGRPVVRLLSMGVLAATVVVGCLVMDRFLAARAEVASATELVQRAKNALAPPPAPAPRKLSSAEKQELDRVNAVVNSLNMPWSELLDALERRASAEVGLTLVEPDGDKGIVKIQAEAKTIDTLLAYADDFARDASFAGVQVRQHDTNEQDANRPARLTFDVRLFERPQASGGAK
jgi:hypothetical protein